MVKKKANKSKAQKECRHHWMIETAAGPTSKGVCQFCGAQKEFKNYLPDCLKISKEEYEGWLRRQRHDEKRRKPEENILSRFGGGEEDAAN